MAGLTNKSLWKSEFDRKNFSLDHSDSSSFCKSQWGEAVWPFAAFRSMLFIYALCVEVYAPISYNYGAKFLIFATYWALLSLVTGLFVSSLNSWMFYYRQKHTEHHRALTMTWNVKIQWLLANIYTSTAIIVTVMYWLIVFEGNLQFENFNTHAVNLIIVILEFAVSRAPVRLLHFYQPTFLLFIYTVFTLIYWQAGGTNDKGQRFIYKSTDYDNKLGSGLVITLVTAFIATPIVHLIVFLLYIARLWLCRRVYSKEVITANDPEPVVIDRQLATTS